MLQWARAQGCPWDFRTCAWAAVNGHFAVLQWARAQGCPCNQETYRREAEAALAEAELLMNMSKMMMNMSKMMISDTKSEVTQFTQGRGQIRKEKVEVYIKKWEARTCDIKVLLEKADVLFKRAKETF